MKVYFIIITLLCVLTSTNSAKAQNSIESSEEKKKIIPAKEVQIGENVQVISTLPSDTTIFINFEEFNKLATQRKIQKRNIKNQPKEKLARKNLFTEFESLEE